MDAFKEILEPWNHYNDEDIFPLEIYVYTFINYVLAHEKKLENKL